MHTITTDVPVESRASLGSRISWSAVFGGAVIALSMQFLLTLLGAASGLSLSDRVSGKAIENGAMIYLALSIFASLFVGGVITSLLTGGEDKQEAIISGFVMWGAGFVALLFLGSAGIQGGANVLTSATSARAQVAPMTWEESARQAGVTEAQVNELKAKNSNIAAQVQDPANQQAAKAAVTRATWFGFFITWISMLFAAAGAYLGAGPTFRVTALIGGRALNATKDERSYAAAPAHS